MRLLANAFSIARMEFGLFNRFPKLRLSVPGIIIIPALYALIYLSSVWDPSSRTEALPAIIVNLDQGVSYRGQDANLGKDLTANLLSRRTFGFTESGDEAAARQSVRAGDALFALVIPQDFSQNAVPGEKAGSGKLVVFASEGNNYTGSGFARRFASELGHQVNQTLNEKRWSLVLGVSADSSASLEKLRAGVDQLQAGAHALSDGLGKARNGATQLDKGSQQLSGGVTQLSNGMQQLGAGIRTMNAKLPADKDLQALKAGVGQLNDGHAQLAEGLAALEAGERKLAAGAAQLREESKALPFGASKVSGAAGQLAEGAEQLTAGLGSARDGQARLADGTHTLGQGVISLADGMGALGGGIRTMASKLPDDSTLTTLSTGGEQLNAGARQLDNGLRQLHEGSMRLAGGLDTLSDSLPKKVEGMGGSAKGLADSVEPEIQIDAPVANNGTGFAPNFLPVAIWLGCVMTAFVFHLRRLPEGVKHHGPVTLLLGKFTLLGSIVLLQSLMVMLMAAFLLQIHILSFAGLALTLCLAALTFMLIILALVRAFGDAGKAVALILLILQLSSAGGVVPIELSSDFFRAISPWLPFTWVVKAVRASMFGAFDGQWLQYLGVLAVFSTVAFLVAALAGRWRFVGPEEHRPAMDI